MLDTIDTVVIFLAITYVGWFFWEVWNDNE